jgi:hypothetical protein
LNSYEVFYGVMDPHIHTNDRYRNIGHGCVGKPGMKTRRKKGEY